MARRVFFSFHYDDVWQANQVRNSNVVAGPEVAGFFDHSEYLQAKLGGDQAIRRMIRRHLEGTSVTVVLIGARTAYRPWVQYEIEQSIARDNGLLGINIHHLKRPQSTLLGGSGGLSLPSTLLTMPSAPGPMPYVPINVQFPVYDWDRNLDRFRREIEAAGQRADALRRNSLPSRLFGQ